MLLLLLLMFTVYDTNTGLDYLKYTLGLLALLVACKKRYIQLEFELTFYVIMEFSCVVVTYKRDRRIHSAQTCLA